MATSVAISLDAQCYFPSCTGFAVPLHRQLSHGYDECAVLPLVSVEEWRSRQRSARKRADRCERLGYHFSEIAREEHSEGIYEINTSLAERQGRPMTPGYREYVTYLKLPDYECSRHAIYTYGVMSARGELAAYLWVYRAGDLALVSSILGHGERLADDVMFLLFQGAIGEQEPLDGFFVYNRADSGTQGLRDFKERLGFMPMEVEWEL